ncbi:phosphatase PAP2 family protein [Parvibaculum sp.]|uniref:phosphatase PAP2 family protein n=1 Tax=Parvibaculum sp. TaxID=2024848 RepID=UPI00391A28C2
MSEISPALQHRRDMALPLEIAAAAALILFFAFWPPVHALDIRLESYLFDQETGQWLMPPQNRDLLYWLIYRGPKLALSVAGGAAFMWLCLQALQRRWQPRHTQYALGLAVVALVPLISGLLKAVTGVSCPAQEAQFAGPYLHSDMVTRLLRNLPYNEHLRCWPAGHASAGFALIGLRLIAPPLLRSAFLYTIPGVAAGWLLGVYQMARGQHYLSHTFVTMAIALAISSLACMWLARIEDRG